MYWNGSPGSVPGWVRGEGLKQEEQEESYCARAGSGMGGAGHCLGMRAKEQTQETF